MAERLHESLHVFDLGGFSNNNTAPKKPQKTLANALCCRIAQSLGEDFHLSPRQKTVIECLQRPHAQDFLIVIPIEGLGQRMSAVEYRSILKYRLMILMFPNDETCPDCRKACLDKYGEQALHCRELSGFKYRHDFVRDPLMDILRRVIFGWGWETCLCRSHRCFLPSRVPGKWVCGGASGTESRVEEGGKARESL
ncbi:putative exostosin [Helianthus debilis subsp. tardiflorus]